MTYSVLLCNVKDSLQYGIPGGLFLFALLVAQLRFEWYEFTVARWAIGIGIVLVISLFTIKGRSQGIFEFRIAWFSGFNVLFVAVMSYLLLGLALSGFLESIGSNQLNFNLHVAIMEFFGLMTIGILVTTAFAYVFKRKD